MTVVTGVLSDGRPGHFNQSLGMLNALPADARKHRIIELPPPRKALKNLALLLAISLGALPAMARAVFRLYYGVPPPVCNDCHLLLSTGGDTLVANILLARLAQRPNVFIGKRSFFTDRGVRLVFAAEGEEIPGRVVMLEFGPVNVPSIEARSIEARSIEAQSINARRRENPKLLAVLIGGDSTEYRWDDADHAALAASLNTLCERTGIRLLLTTSRRTGERGEAVLREQIAGKHLADATWYHSAPRPVLRDYCVRADAILCSEDSGTMLTESIHYGRPVFSCHPRARRLTPFYERFLARLAAHGLVFTDIAGVATLDVAGTPAARPADHRAAGEALRALLAR